MNCLKAFSAPACVVVKHANPCGIAQLDDIDAAFFAANSVELDVFVLTSSFTIYLTKPISTGVLRAEGKLVNMTRSQFIAESILYDSDNKEIARGSGVYVRSKVKLSSVSNYYD